MVAPALKTIGPLGYRNANASNAPLYLWSAPPRWPWQSWLPAERKRTASGLS